jgi:AraC-like DNA-binding protein
MLAWSSHTAPVLAQARVDPRYRMFVMRPDHEGAVRINGHFVDENRLIDQRPGTQLHLSTGNGAASRRTLAGLVQLIAILVEPRELDRVAVSLTGENFTSGPSLCTLVLPNPRALAALRKLITDSLCSVALASVEDSDESLDYHAAMAEALLGAVVETVLTDHNRRRGHELTRDLEARVVARAAEVPDEEDGGPVPLSLLCTVSGANERQLQRAFQSVYGVSPKRYLKLRRLHRVRLALRRAGPEDTVATVAGNHGFSDLGRFASAYRALFDEPPSATLAGCERQIIEESHAPVGIYVSSSASKAL